MKRPVAIAIWATKRFPLGVPRVGRDVHAEALAEPRLASQDGVPLNPLVSCGTDPAYPDCLPQSQCNPALIDATAVCAGSANAADPHRCCQRDNSNSPGHNRPASQVCRTERDSDEIESDEEGDEDVQEQRPQQSTKGRKRSADSESL